MALSGVQPQTEADFDLAARLAKRWGVPLLDGVESVHPSMPNSSAVKVIVNGHLLALAFLDAKKGKPYIVDFQSSTWRSRFAQPLSKQHIFRRAIGLKGDSRPKILDATAGFGQDSLMALSLGCEVTAVEKSPVVFELLLNGIDRAREDEVVGQALSRLRLVQGDSSEFLKSLNTSSAPDVVLIDPMFDKPKKSAKSPKEMQLLQELLLGSELTDEDALLTAALRVARQRVVIKRPLKTRSLRPISNSYKGQSIRYDVYLVNSKKI